jgi:ABC-type branched-subunit amino acid transport system ATPase component
MAFISEVHCILPVGAVNYVETLKAAAATAILVLKDVTVSVQRGEVLAVVGSVGAGKTTLLQAVIGELTALHGTVHAHQDIGFGPLVFGQDIARKDAIGSHGC